MNEENRAGNGNQESAQQSRRQFLKDTVAGFFWGAGSGGLLSSTISPIRNRGTPDLERMRNEEREIIDQLNSLAAIVGSLHFYDKAYVNSPNETKPSRDQEEPNLLSNKGKEVVELLEALSRQSIDNDVKSFPNTLKKLKNIVEIIYSKIIERQLKPKDITMDEHIKIIKTLILCDAILNKIGLNIQHHAGQIVR